MGFCKTAPLDGLTLALANFNGKDDFVPSSGSMRPFLSSSTVFNRGARAEWESVESRYLRDGAMSGGMRPVAMRLRNLECTGHSAEV
jgi:hypothetical protein